MGKTKGTRPLNWSSLVIFYLSFLRVVFDDYGPVIGQGLIFIADDQFAARTYADACSRFTDCDVFQVNLRNYQKQNYKNYNAAILLLAKESVEKVDEFLDNQEFFPIVIAGGILPEDLRTGHYVFRLLAHVIENSLTLAFRDHVATIKKYLITNIDVVCKAIRLTESSEAYLEYSQYRKYAPYRSLLYRLIAVGEIHRTYLRSSEGEKVERSFYEKYIKNCLHFLDGISETSDDQDVQLFVAHALWQAIDDRDIYDVISLDQMNQELLDLYASETIILYDDEFYYVDEEDFKSLCYPLLESFSWLELKHKLAEANLIEKARAGFTFKKSITVGTETTRIRVMKLHKEFLLNSERGLLEDYSFEREDNENE